MNDKYQDWDEDSYRARPVKNKKASKPRTKNQPDHNDAVLGFVTTVDRGRYTVKLQDSHQSDRTVIATRGSNLRKTQLVVGDYVWLIGDLSGSKGALSRIVRLEERKTVLRRSADDTDDYERVVVANAQQMLIVVSAADPTPRPAFIDRALVTAFDAGIYPIILITKTDLNDPKELISLFEDLHIPILVSKSTSVAEEEQLLNGRDLDTLRTYLTKKITVLVGPSGVGKSTLLNNLTESERTTSHVNTVTGRGRHTSSSALAEQILDDSGQVMPDSWAIDTPGIRSFGLGFVNPENIISAFDDLTNIEAHCPKGCHHSLEEIHCAFNDSSLKMTPNQKRRITSLRKLLANKDTKSTQN